MRTYKTTKSKKYFGIKLVGLLVLVFYMPILIVGIIASYISMAFVGKDLTYSRIAQICIYDPLDSLEF